MSTIRPFSTVVRPFVYDMRPSNSISKMASVGRDAFVSGRPPRPPITPPSGQPEWLQRVPLMQRMGEYLSKKGITVPNPVGASGWGFRPGIPFKERPVLLNEAEKAVRKAGYQGPPLFPPLKKTAAPPKKPLQQTPLVSKSTNPFRSQCVGLTAATAPQQRFISTPKQTLDPIFREPSEVTGRSRASVLESHRKGYSREEAVNNLLRDKGSLIQGSDGKFTWKKKYLEDPNKQFVRRMAAEAVVNKHYPG